MNNKRFFLIVLDSFGVGELPDAKDYGDENSNTFRSCFSCGKLNIPNMRKLGLFNIDGVDFGSPYLGAMGAYGKMAELSKGKDTTVGHWELSGLVSEKGFPTFYNGFPKEIIDEFKKLTGRGVLCNKPYSGTEVIKDYGLEHIKTGDLIVYTSADSVFQIAAHEDIIPLNELYRYCEIARKMLVGDFAVGRVIARPFTGEYPNFTRTSNRHDYSFAPPDDTMLDVLKENGFDVIAVGKINDIFAGKGITQSFKTGKNEIGIDKTEELTKTSFNGLCFVNLVDFDMVYGHRNDVVGYTEALNYFDKRLGELIKLLSKNDVLAITADHGCDPLTESTDHSREYVPLLICGNGIKKGYNIGVRNSFADLAKTILEYFGIDGNISGNGFYDLIEKKIK